LKQVTITITGASNGATFSWDQKLVALVSTGNGGWSGTVQAASGSHIHSVVVFGQSNDPWTATVTDGTTTQNFAGHISPSGADTTGDTIFGVKP